MIDETDYCLNYGVKPGSPVTMTIYGLLEDINNHGSLDNPKIMANVQMQKGLGFLLPIDQIGPYHPLDSLAKNPNIILLNVWRDFGCPSMSGDVWGGGSSTLKDVYTYLRKHNLITEKGKIRADG